MDRVTALMPPEAPLPMPVQDFTRAHRDGAAPADTGAGAGLWRALAFSPAMAATAALLWIMADWFAEEGISGVEATLLALIAFNFFWIAFTVSTVLIGVWSLVQRRRAEPAGPPAPQRVALLMPIYNELPWYVLGNARSILEELRDSSAHSYSLYVLSDTSDDDIAGAERDSVRALRAALGCDIAIYYRRRTKNTDRKSGNIADWVARWGGAHDAMLVLDADSLMTGAAIAALSDTLARDPGAGLIQSFPQLIGAQSVFARMQQFANGVYGAAFAEGLARWCGQEGNYWGHNAIIRTRAFAACAGLPHLKGDRLIMSHDFVEAGLLRRAGWKVRFLPRIQGSYEETPPTLIDHIRRDRRWCQGNLQHLRLLGARGFLPVSRFHLLHGAVGYLLAPIWFALLVMWALIGPSEDASVLNYFSEANPLMPSWPRMSEGQHVLIIVLMYAMLLAPKLLGAAALPLTGGGYGDFGGKARFIRSFLAEIFLSILYAPVLMVQQMIAVLRILTGLQRGWQPQARIGGEYGLLACARCHALESVSGMLLMAGIVIGAVSAWLLPIAISLTAAIALSRISGHRLERPFWLRTSEDIAAPPISQAAARYRRDFRTMLESRNPNPVPAQ